MDGLQRSIYIRNNGGDMVTAILRFHLDSVWNELPSRSEGHTCDLDLEASDSDIEANRHRHLIKVFRQEDTHLCSKSWSRKAHMDHTFSWKSVQKQWKMEGSVFSMSACTNPVSTPIPSQALETTSLKLSYTEDPQPHGAEQLLVSWKFPFS